MSDRAEKSRTETSTASTVEAVFAEHLGQRLGDRHVRDARDHTGLRVDFTYDDAEPPLALEVSTITDSRWREAVRTAETHLTDQLGRVAIAEQLGRWTIEISQATAVRDLAERILPLMRAGRSVAPGHYSSAEVLAAEQEGRREAFLAEHRSLAKAGLSRITREAHHPHGVQVATWTNNPNIEGFREALDKAVEDNAEKLAEARPRRTALALRVDRWDCSQAHERTPVPRLPSAIDHLLVVHHLRPPAVIWHARRQDTAWSIFSKDRGR